MIVHNEYMEGNLCNTLCPRKLLDAVEYREAAIHASLFRRAVIASTVGVIGIRQALRVKSCPQRRLAEEDYTPAGTCTEQVTSHMLENPISPLLLTEGEYAVLKRYMHPDNLFQRDVDK
jgi:hypothetical protein